MRLDFNVLWVDDQPDRVKAQIDAIAKQMEAEGFLFNPTLCRSVAEVKERISDNVFTDEVDLILVDWDLGDGVVGQDAIAEIRVNIQYKDVVFYSAQTTPEQLRLSASEYDLEGIYCATRGELVDEVMGVFESLVKKVLDLDHTRGIVMGATSDIDYMVQECLASMHGRLDAAGQQEMLKEALERVDDRVKDLIKKAEKLKGAKDMTTLFDAHMIFTANDRLRILGGTLEKEAFKAHAEAKVAIVAYMEDVVPERNILGHLVLVPEGKPQEVTDSKGQPISLDKTRELRRRLLGLRKDFNDLLIALQAVG